MIKNSDRKGQKQRNFLDRQSKPDIKKSYRNTRRKFMLKTFVVFLAIFILKDYILFLRLYLLVTAPFLAGLLLWVKSITTGDSFINVIKDTITFIPVSYAEKELKLDRRIWVTYVIILVNILIYYGIRIFPEVTTADIYCLFVYPPIYKGLFNSLLSPIVSMFLHIDNWHLWGNMLFLWIFGVVVERRIGWKWFVVSYLITGVCAALFSDIIYNLFKMKFECGLGASGAISGIMGIFMVRLFFKKMVFPIPILGIFSLFFPLALKIRINSMIVIGIFFISNLSSGIDQIAEIKSPTGYWAHIFGMLSGILLALFFKLQEDAFHEMHLEKGIQEMEERQLTKDGEESMRIVLDTNPENEIALLALARKKSRHKLTDEGYDLYQRVIKIALKSDPDHAAELFTEYFRLYWRNIDPDLQYRMAAILFRKGDFDTATRAMEMLVDDDNVKEEIREKVLLQLAIRLEQINLPDAAYRRYKQFIHQFQKSPHLEKVLKKLNKMKENNP